MQSKTRLVSNGHKNWKAWNGCDLWAFPDGFTPGRQVKIVKLLSAETDHPIIAAPFRDMAIAARIG